MLEQLGIEEGLLAGTCETVRSIHAALRRGDLPALQQFRAEQARLADDLLVRAQVREAASAALASLVGLNVPRPTLREIAARLPAEESRRLLDQRNRLQDLSQIIAQFQGANANLIAHLRSYFRGVLATLIDEGIPTRYGPGGLRPVGAVGLALHAMG